MSEPVREIVEWRNASPLWARATADADPGPRLRQPTVLRFASDAFIEDLQGVLADAPARLADYVLRAETWRETLKHPAHAAGWQAEPLPATVPKLYQALHGRFYLLAASLVCRRVGLPDHRLDTAAGERVHAVLRRVRADGGEQGWSKAGGWQDVAGDAVLGDEEGIALFPMYFREDGRPRRLFACLIPTTGRDTQKVDPVAATAALNARIAQTPAGQLSPEDPRPNWFRTRIVAPLDGARAGVAQGALKTVAQLKQNNDPGWLDAPMPIVELSRFWLLDLRDFLIEHVPQVWTWIDAAAAPPPAQPPLSAQEQAILDLLDARTIRENGAAPKPLSDGLREIDSVADQLLARGAPDSRTGALYDISTIGSAANFGATLLGLLENWFTVQRTVPPPDAAETPAVARDDAGFDADTAHYVMRCVYVRPRCAGRERSLVGAASPAFRFSGFFDEDAPAREINITLPKDTGIGALRRFQRGVSMSVSSKLRNQMERIRGVTMGDVDDGKLGAEGNLSFGTVCSLSIPIVTLVALILLMIMVQLLNIVFWWLPFLKVCLPRAR